VLPRADEVIEWWIVALFAAFALLAATAGRSDLLNVCF
jgi:hypothetical protein